MGGFFPSSLSRTTCPASWPPSPPRQQPSLLFAPQASCHWRSSSAGPKATHRSCACCSATPAAPPSSELGRNQLAASLPSPALRPSASSPSSLSRLGARLGTPFWGLHCGGGWLWRSEPCKEAVSIHGPRDRISLSGTEMTLVRSVPALYSLFRQLGHLPPTHSPEALPQRGGWGEVPLGWPSAWREVGR